MFINIIRNVWRRRILLAIISEKMPEEGTIYKTESEYSSEANVLHRFWNSHVILQPRTTFYWRQTTQHMEIFIIKCKNDISCILINFLINLYMHITHFITFSPTLFLHHTIVSLLSSLLVPLSYSQLSVLFCSSSLSICCIAKF